MNNENKSVTKASIGKWDWWEVSASLGKNTHAKKKLLKTVRQKTRSPRLNALEGFENSKIKKQN